MCANQSTWSAHRWKASNNLPTVTQCVLDVMKSMAETRTYRAGEQIIGFSREEGGVFIVVKGLVALFPRPVHLTPEKLTEYRAPGEAFELYGLGGTDERGPYVLTGKAITDDTVTLNLPWFRYWECVSVSTSASVASLRTRCYAGLYWPTLSQEARLLSSLARDAS